MVDATTGSPALAYLVGGGGERVALTQGQVVEDVRAEPCPDTPVGEGVISAAPS
jgi:hypothetical protein